MKTGWSVLSLAALLMHFWAGSGPAQKANPTAEVRARLAEVVSFAGFDDPKTTLEEAIDMMTKRYNFKCIINQAAFKDLEGGVEKVEIATPNSLSPMRAPLSSVMRKILARIPSASEATFVINKGVIEVTTVEELRKREMEPEPRPIAAARVREIFDRLNSRIHFPGFDDPKTTLAEALDVLEKRYNLSIEVHERAFLKAQVENVLATEIAAPKALPPLKDASVSEVLVAVMKRVPGRAVYAVRPDGVIEITTSLTVNPDGAKKRPGPPAVIPR
jgi:hypothetical protein